MKDPAEEHRSGFKEDIKKAQSEKLVGDTPEKQLPNTDVPCSLLPRKPTEKRTIKKKKKKKNNLHNLGRTRRTSAITGSSPGEKNSLKGIRGYTKAKKTGKNIKKMREERREDVTAMF